MARGVAGRAHAGRVQHALPQHDLPVHVAIKEKERLFAGEPEPEHCGGGRGLGSPARHWKRSEYATCGSCSRRSLSREDTKRVMGFVDRIARERGWALSGLMKAREATALGLDMFVDNARSHVAE